MERSRAKTGRASLSSGPRIEKAIAIMQPLLFALAMLVVLYPPYFRGLFFETNALWAEILVFIIFTAYSVLKHLKQEVYEIKTHLDIASLAFAVIYALSMITAVYFRDAIAEWLKYCMYFSLFFMLSDMLRSGKDRVRVMWVIAFSGTGIALLGFDGATGSHLAGLLNKVFGGLGYKYDIFFKLYSGGRMSSTMQYSNALGGYLIAVFFLLLGLIILSDKWWQKALAGAMSFLVLEAFILTLSRGAYLMMAVAAVLFIVVLPAEQRGRGIVLGLVQLVTAAVIYLRVSDLIAGEYLRMTAITVLVGTMAAAILTLAAGKLSDLLGRFRPRVYALIAGALVLVLAVSVLILSSYTQPFTASHGSEEANSSKGITRSVQLAPGDYKLYFDINASNEGDKPYSASLSVTSQSKDDIIFRRSTVLVSETYKDTTGVFAAQKEFTVPEGSKLVSIRFYNYYQGTAASIDNVVIQDAATGKTVKNLALSYKYIPESIVSRVQNMFVSNSSYVRAVFYKDGLNIFAHNPLLGVGGGGWKHVYNQYQSYQYWSELPHNFWLQVPIETGFLGVITLLYLLGGIIFYQFILRRKGAKSMTDGIIAASVFTAAAGLLGHSAIDFDLQLTAIFLLLWELLAILNSIYREGESKLRIRFSSLLPAVLAALLIILPASYKSAEVSAIKAIEIVKGGEQKRAMSKMEKAIAADPKNAKYRIDYANMIVSPGFQESELTAANKFISAAYRLGYNNPEVLSYIYNYALRTGNVVDGLEISNRLITLRPYWDEAWQAKTKALYEAGIYLFSAFENESALKSMDQTIAIMREAAEVNKGNMNPFVLNDYTVKQIENAQYIKDNFKEGESIKIDNVIFYYVPGMDVNSDGEPDQWNLRAQENMRLEEKDGILQASNANPEVSGYIESRKLTLEKESKYEVRIELDEAGALGQALPQKIAFNIPGNIGTTHAEGEGGVYTADFETKESVNANYGIRIFVTDDISIKSVVISKAEQEPAD